jgi:hypothetical protein
VTIWDCITDLFDVLGRTALFDEADGYVSIDFSIKFLTGGRNLLELIRITVSLSFLRRLTSFRCVVNCISILYLVV